MELRAVLMGDGSVRYDKDSINGAVLVVAKYAVPRRRTTPSQIAASA